jgi:hypothetical protein
MFTVLEYSWRGGDIGLNRAEMNKLSKVCSWSMEEPFTETQRTVADTGTTNATAVASLARDIVI